MESLKTFLIATSLACCLLTGCASVQSSPGQASEWLTPSNSFRMLLPPFVHADVAYGARVPVVGTTERSGHRYRVVVLPDPAASGLRILINDDGSFEGSAINLTGAMMGFSYEADPPRTKLVAIGQAVPSHSYAGVPCDTTVPAQYKECEDSHVVEGLDAYGRKPQEAAQRTPLQRLVGCISVADRTLLPMVAENMLLGDRQSGAQLSEGRSRITICTDENVKTAVESAGKASDLREAIKSLYVKQRAWADSLLPNGSQTKITYRQDVSHSTSELDQAISKVQLEAKLAAP